MNPPNPPPPNAVTTFLNDWATAATDAVDAWVALLQKGVSSLSSDTSFYNSYATLLGDLANLSMGWAKGGSPKINAPIAVKSDPKQAPSIGKVSVSLNAYTRLRPTSFLDGHGHTIPDTLVSVVPIAAGPGNPIPVQVEIRPQAGVPGGQYGGNLVDDDGNQVLAAPVTINVVIV